MRISDWSSDVCSSDLSCSTVFRPKVLLTRESVMTDMRLAPLKPDSAVAWRKALQAPGDSMMTVTGRFLCGPGRRQIAGGLRQIDCRREKRGNRNYARLFDPAHPDVGHPGDAVEERRRRHQDRKSTRLNSSH